MSQLTASIPARLNITVDCDDGEHPSPQAIRHALIMHAEQMTDEQLIDLFDAADEVEEEPEDCGNAAEDAYDSERAEAES